MQQNMRFLFICGQISRFLFPAKISFSSPPQHTHTGYPENNIQPLSLVQIAKDELKMYEIEITVLRWRVEPTSILEYKIRRRAGDFGEDIGAIKL